MRKDYLRTYHISQTRQNEIDKMEKYFDDDGFKENDSRANAQIPNPERVQAATSGKDDDFVICFVGDSGASDHMTNDIPTYFPNLDPNTVKDN